MSIIGKDPFVYDPLGQLSMAAMQAQAQAMEAKPSNSISINIKSVKNGYVITTGVDTYIAETADEIKDIVIQAMVTAKITQA